MANVVFVDEDDNVIGAGTKQEIWQKGIWHRIARIFLFNSKGELLITKRSDALASLAGRWDQSAAGHVDEGESYRQAAERELSEEVGVQNVPLEEIAKTKNIETDEPDKIKKRFSMIYVGHYDGEIFMSPDEVSETKWIEPKALLEWMQQSPNDFTEGFIVNFKKLLELKHA